MGSKRHIRYSVDDLPPSGGRWVHPVVHVDRIEVGIPRLLVDQYVDAAMRHAFVQDLGADGWFAEIKGFKGVYGDGATRAAAIDDLRDALPGWVEFKLASGAEVPDINGFSLPRHAAGASNLAWESVRDNLARREVHGTTDRGFSNSRASVTPEDVASIKRMVADGVTHLEAARRHGVSRTTVSRIINGQRFTEGCAS